MFKGVAGEYHSKAVEGDILGVWGGPGKTPDSRSRVFCSRLKEGWNLG